MDSINHYNPLKRTSTPQYPHTHSIHPSKLREAQEKRMAYTQTFQLAQRARGKLQREASQHDHNLRLLVGHANLLDSLMIALSEAEREQEQWFNDAVQGSIAADDDEEEAIEKEREEEDEREEDEEERDWPHPSSFDGHGWLAADYYSESDSDEDSESEVDSDEDMEGIEYTIPRVKSMSSQRSLPPLFQDTIHTMVVNGVGNEDEDEDDEDADADEDEHGMYSLRRTPSSHGSPPQLVADLTDDEEEESAPPSPPQLSLPFASIDTTIKEKGSITTTSFFNHDSSTTHHDPFIYAIHQPPSVISTF